MDPLAVWFQVPLREDGDRRRGPRPRRKKAEREVARRPAPPGPLHPRFRWQQLEAALTVTFGGWTRHPDVEGEWFDDEQGVPVRERSRAYAVDVPEERLEALERLLRRACLTFCQKCIRMVMNGRARLIREDEHDEPL